MRTGIIILAAGSSSRMGTSKQLLQINGEALLVRSVKTAQEAGADETVVVLGANEEPHRDALKALQVDIMHHPGWESGMGGSLKAGLAYLLLKAPHLEAVVVMVCDQPLLTSQHLQNLIRATSTTKASIVASQYGGSAGVPALFTKTHFSELSALEDSQGAKKIIQLHANTLATLDFPDGTVDLDTPSDVQNLKHAGDSKT